MVMVIVIVPRPLLRFGKVPEGAHQQRQECHSQQNSHPAPDQQWQVVANHVARKIPPLPEPGTCCRNVVRRSDEQGGHHARVLVGQKVAMQDRLAGVILVLDPDAGPAVGRNGDRVPPNAGIKVCHLVQDGIRLRRKLGTHFLDLEAVDVNVERMVVVVGIDQNIFHGFAGIGVKVDPVRRKGLPVDVILREGCHVAVGSHAKHDGFRPGDLVGFDRFLLLVTGCKYHLLDGNRRQQRCFVFVCVAVAVAVDGFVFYDVDFRQKLVVGMPVHAKELHALDALLGNNVLSGFVELQQQFFALAAGKDNNVSPPGFAIGDPVAGNHVNGNRVFLPIVLGIIDIDIDIVALRCLVHYERELVFDRRTQHPQMQDLADHYGF
mmetsp:Transcript_11911/g.25160  ORF Transcript_11911/g.25160 Transcript_11911/m.25160 type:complete len:378 (-) Transcript_11911:1204-2337(-)